MKKLFTSLLVILGFGISFSQVYLSENFNDGTMPDGWTSEFTGAGGWEITNSPGNWPIEGADGSYALFDDDANGNGSVDTGILTSSAVDLSGISSVVLSFDYLNVQYQTASSLTVEVYDGSAWQQVFYTNQNEYEGANPGFLSAGPIDIASYANAAFKVRFKYNDAGDWSYGAAIDNVKVETLQSNNAALDNINLTPYIVTNEDNMLSIEVKNTGANPITEVTVNWSDESDHSAQIPTSIGIGETVTVEHPTPLNYADIDEHTIDVSITMVNNVADADPSDNSGSAVIHTISADGGKKVLVEEGTGTWCGWCPRGAVGMEYASENYPDTFIGIAVHNNDPMQNNEYNSRAGFSAFPGMNVDRTVMGDDPSGDIIENHILQRQDIPNPVKIDINPTVSGNELTVEASATFYSNFSDANFRLAAILVEDDVTGTTSGYNQANYYSGGGNGAMGGYENLPNPVPAADMVYNHVGRALLGGYDGQEGSVPNVISDGQTATYTFNYTIPDEFFSNHLHVVVLVIDDNNGQVLNANKADLGVLAVSDVNSSSGFSLYPNPATDFVNLKIEQSGDYSIKIYDLTGKAVYTQKAQSLNSNATVKVPVSNINSGVYVISIEGKNQSFTKKLIVK
jgi:hypothetical protein